MFNNRVKFVMVLALMAIWQPPACNTQFYQQNYDPYPGSVSRANSQATERQLGLGALGISQAVVNSQTETDTNGGYGNGGVTSVANSKARTKELNLGGLEVGSTLTTSKTQTNGAVSRAIAHNFNVGGVDIGSSFSRNNLRKGIGFHRSQDGGLGFGLGLLDFDLSRKQQQQSQAATQAQAQAQGANAFATADSNAATHSRQFGLLGFSKTQSESNALSAANYGQTSALAGGLAGRSAGNANSFGLFRVRRSIGDTLNLNYDIRTRAFVRPKRKAEFIPFVYPDDEVERPRPQFGKPSLNRPRPNNAIVFPNEEDIYPEGLTDNNKNDFQQQTGANSQSRQELNANGLFQNNAASSIGSNLAKDGSSGQLSSANVNQDNSVTSTGFQSTNNAQSQALNFDKNQQQAANANAVTKEIKTDGGSRLEAQGGSQSTNNNQFGSSSNIANTNSVSYENDDSRGSQADSSSQSIFQGNNGQNSAAQTNSKVESKQGADGSVSNTASSNASAVSHGGQSANAVASASSSSGSNGGNTFTNANSNAGNIGDLLDFGGASANSGAFGNFGGAQAFANGQSRFRAFKIRKRRSTSFYSQPRRQQQNQTSTATLEIMKSSTEINWPQNRIQLFDRYQQQQQQQQQPHSQPPPQPQQHGQQPQQMHPQQLHYSSINPNFSIEQFAEIDENKRNGRTFNLITDFINRLARPTCSYPCTLDVYHQLGCCETDFSVPPTSFNGCCQQPPTTPPNICCQQPLPPLPPPIVLRPPPPPPIIIRPLPVVPLSPLPTLNFPLIPSQCCNSCPAYGFYGPSPCIRNTFAGGGPFLMG